jgi:hypothetical protein
VAGWVRHTARQGAKLKERDVEVKVAAAGRVQDRCHSPADVVRVRVDSSTGCLFYVAYLTL